MKPICAHVDQASETLMLMRVIITSAATTAVTLPTTTSRPCAAGTSATSVPRRMSRKPPRFTTPACSSADTGVGASITCINQPCTGSCAHFSSALPTKSSAAACSAPGMAGSAAAAATAWSISSVPSCRATSRMAPSRHRSATRLAMNFLCAAISACGRWSKKVNRPCSARLVAIQAAASTSRLLASTSSVTAASVSIRLRK